MTISLGVCTDNDRPLLPNFVGAGWASALSTSRMTAWEKIMSRFYYFLAAVAYIIVGAYCQHAIVISSGKVEIGIVQLFGGTLVYISDDITSPKIRRFTRFLLESIATTAIQFIAESTTAKEWFMQISEMSSISVPFLFT